jgi:hypothetical protein
MVDREVSGEVNVKVHERKLVAGRRPETSGERQCGQQSTCYTGALEEYSAIHENQVLSAAINTRKTRNLYFGLSNPIQYKPSHQEPPAFGPANGILSLRTNASPLRIPIDHIPSRQHR